MGRGTPRPFKLAFFALVFLGMKITLSAARKILGRSVSPVYFVAGKEDYVGLEPGGGKALYVSTGKREEMTRRKFRLLCRKVVSLAKNHRLKRLAVNFSDLVFPRLRMADVEIAGVAAESFEMADFEFVKYKTPPPEGWSFVEEINIYGKNNREAREGLKQGQIIGEEVNNCRALANTPGGEMTPRILANAATKAGRRAGVRVKVLGSSVMRRLKMGGILGVSKGSSEEPRFIILEYLRGPKGEKPIVLIGKGVTFDTGGVNLKPADAMYEMHMDMSGGAAVIYVLVLAACLGLKKNIVGLIPAAENMTSGSSYRPGDILRAMSGKTVEVLNTDAEGRIILADALTYARRYNPRLVVDAATLTGAAVVALGQRASAIFTRDRRLEQLFRELGEESGDYVWPLPLWEEYEEEVMGTFGDVANVQKSKKYGGAIAGAMFLYQFAKDLPWVHVDIAPRMTAIEGEYLAKGAAGAPVRLFLKLCERF